MTFWKRKTAGTEDRSVGARGCSQGRSGLPRGSLPSYFLASVKTILYLDGSVVILYAFIRMQRHQKEQSLLYVNKNKYIKTHAGCYAEVPDGKEGDQLGNY